MNTLTLSSNFALGTTPPIFMLDALRGPLPFKVRGGNGFTQTFDAPEELKSICWGRRINIHPSGDVSIGQYNLMTNGTRLIYGELGNPYKQFAKNENHLKMEDLPDIRRILHIPDECEFPDALYRYHIETFHRKIQILEQCLSSKGFDLCWNLGTNYLRRIEICVDFLIPLERDALIEHLDEAISIVCGEPFRSGDYRHKKNERKEKPHHYWDHGKLTDEPLQRGQAEFKLYDKGTLGRLELACINLPLSPAPLNANPVDWFNQQLVQITEAMASRLSAVVQRLVSQEKRVNEVDRTLLVEGLTTYSPFLKLRDDRVKYLVESLISRATYTPNCHKGHEIGRKLLKKLTDPEIGICENKYTKDFRRIHSIVLRSDWREQIYRQFKNKCKQAALPEQLSPISTPNLGVISRRDFLFQFSPRRLLDRLTSIFRPHSTNGQPHGGY